MKYEAIRKTVLEAILEAVEKGLINGTSGNIAMRDSEDSKHRSNHTIRNFLHRYETRRYCDC